jgi:hypothetical protein
MNLEEKSLRPWDMLQASLQEDHNDKKTRWNCHCSRRSWRGCL